ncbi:hypothetical protein E3O21_17180 [Cryobacterium flavum]|uniref:Uncharacterized protein n=1 Tax=Cryobacterium flavum TaxID=1424659 RepID=A0ABY2HXR6_9MICO|nr:hypothetical protein E3O21_17180 [Cryobacterium flavum]
MERIAQQLLTRLRRTNRSVGPPRESPRVLRDDHSEQRLTQLGLQSTNNVADSKFHSTSMRITNDASTRHRLHSKIRQTAHLQWSTDSSLTSIFLSGNMSGDMTDNGDYVSF